MSTSALVGLCIGGAITVYCLVWLWRLPASLAAKLFWTLVCILLPGIGTMLLLEVYAPMAPGPRGSGEEPRVYGPAPEPVKLPPALLAGYLSICALLFGAIWAVSGAVALATGRGESWAPLLGGILLLAFGGYFMRRGSQQLAAVSE